MAHKMLLSQDGFGKAFHNRFVQAEGGCATGPIRQLAGAFEFVGRSLFSASCALLGLLGIIGLLRPVLVLFSQFRANCTLADTDLLGDELLSLFLFVERLNEVPHRRPGFVLK